MTATSDMHPATGGSAAASKKPKTVIVGGGIGGLTAAIALHKVGADVWVYEQAPKLMEIGAGINVQAVAIGVLDDLGISVSRWTEAEECDGIVTSKLEYFTADGVFIADEPVGQAAGSEYPQMSVHRAKFHTTLVNECRRLLGDDRVILDSSFDRLEQDEGKVTAYFNSMSTKQAMLPVTCDFLIGCDGLKSPVRAALLGEQLPKYTGITIYRGLCEVDGVNGDGNTVSLCGDEISNFICYPVSDSMRRAGKWHCNWGYVCRRPEPTGVESWVAGAKVDDIREEMARFDGNKFGGLTPLQIAEKTDKIIGWCLFDRDPIASFDFGKVTLLGDAAHPLLPYGSQGATQAIMDAEALAVCYDEAMQKGTGVQGCIKAYSEMRCEVTGKIVLANRDMGATKVLREAKQRCEGMEIEAKRKWCGENGQRLYQEVILKYRQSLPKSIRPAKKAKTA
eukprot:TRINITY_DN2446_c0_g1_i1.p1 TRINITY_DN2446_c0_g1~~TRINITY_DN2446_c0_g1_i1.p1  ORF type:complete len:451 (+),score=121.98 TRINITY_DN2446_c0_g1_i1:86-1438(+)